MFKTLLFLMIALLITYFLMSILYYILVLILIVYISYTGYIWFDRKLNPGRHIRHSMLKNYMINKYGKKDGVKNYRETVTELRKKGYR